ncbi:MAG: DUF1573 domain-containing protein [Planctomycetaceae bacterium]
MVNGVAARCLCSAILAAGALLGSAAGQDATLNTAPPGVPRAGDDWAEQMFSERSHDFGSVARGADVRHKIQVKNLYEETIKISNVSTTCGCTAAKPDRDTLKTGEIAEIEVTMNTVKFMRDKHSNVDVTVTFDGQTFKMVRIPIKAYIRPDVVVEPGRVDFNAVEIGLGAEKHVTIEYAGRDDWKITGAKTANPLLTAEVQEKARGSGRVSYELVVRLAPSAPAGTFRDQVVLSTDDERSPQVDVAVEGSVVADIVVSPTTLELGSLTPGVPKTMSVVVRGRKSFVIERMECKSERDCYKVRLGPDARNVHVLPVTIVPPSEPGEINETFYLTIQGRSEPVEFSAKGVIGVAAETAAQTK